VIGVITPPLRPARPQHAASLVAVRLAQGQPEVLMGRRRAKARFAPDAWVFPGGKLDADDRCVQPARDLESAVIANLGLPAPKARALAIAALRETAEETGLLIGTPGRLEGPENLTSCAWAAYRAAGLAPDLSGLECIARAITPTSSPIRFNARFFKIDGARLTGQLAGSGELLDLAWFPLAKARSLPLMDVTQAVLDVVERRGRPLVISYRHHRLMLR
jgi:8-oxo-dGTP pyrophosphatase MutT (NUDIX family)